MTSHTTAPEPWAKHHTWAGAEPEKSITDTKLGGTVLRIVPGGSRLKICLVTVNRKYERLFLYSKFQIETGITKKLTNKLNKIS